MSIVTKRTPINEGSEFYLDCEDERALAIDDCGCGKKPHRSLIKFRYGSIEGMIVMFNHMEITGDCCFTAIRHTKADEWIPMSVEEYMAMRADDGIDGSI